MKLTTTFILVLITLISCEQNKKTETAAVPVNPMIGHGN